MALGNRGNDGENANVKFVNISFGKFWIDSDDTEHPDYKTRDYDVAGNQGTKKGLAYTEVKGMLSGAKFYDLKFGNQLKVYIKDEDETYCVNFKLSKSYGHFDMTRKMVLALMFLNKDSEVTLNLITNKKGDREFYNFWVGQDGKSLVLNPELEEDEIDLEKKIAIPSEVMDDYLELGIPFKDEFMAMDSDTQEYKRAEGLKAMRALLEMKYLESDEEKDESTEEGEVAEPEKVKEEVEKEEPVEKELTPREKRLAELKARKKK